MAKRKHLDEIRVLPELYVSPTSAGQYVAGYDNNGNRIYTADRKQSMGYNDGLASAVDRQKAYYKNAKHKNSGKFWANAATAMIGAPLVPMGVAPIASALTPTAEGITSFLINPYVDAGLTSFGGAHAAQSIKNGNADWSTALELTPATRAIKPIYNTALSIGKSFKDVYAPYKISKIIDKGVKENAVITAYNRNPVIKNLGTLWDYQTYLDKVFPNSKIKDVLWHGSIKKGFEKFSTEKIGLNTPIKKSVGMYLTPEKSVANNYVARKGELLPVLLNTEKPFITNQNLAFPKHGVNVSKISPKIKNTILADYDAVVAPIREEIAFFNPDNALILGSNEDVKRFKYFMNNNSSFKQGGSIYIKPSHRGRLTELKSRTGKTESELYNDGNPAHKKMVVFARNARKWKN